VQAISSVWSRLWRYTISRNRIARNLEETWEEAMYKRACASVLAALLTLMIAFAQKPTGEPDPAAEKIPVSELRDFIERYTDDRASVRRTFNLAFSETTRTRMRGFYTSWLARLGKVDFDSLSQDGRIDYVLLKNQLDYEVRQIDIQAKAQQEIAPLLPFAQTIVRLDEARRRNKSRVSGGRSRPTSNPPAPPRLERQSRTARRWLPTN
jgi:hypothetical protein